MNDDDNPAIVKVLNILRTVPIGPTHTLLPYISLREHIHAATIKSIQEESGANIQVPKIGKPNDPTQRTLTISHATEQGANHAKQLIENILRSKPSFASGGPPAAAASSAPSSTSIQVRIPDKDVGLCIGRQGCVIKHMQNTTRTRIQIPQQPNPGDTHRVATISGPPEGCTVAQQMIERIVAEQSSASVMAGAPFQQQRHPHPQQQQSYYGAAGPQENQQGYSAEWAAYHAAQQAAAQQQQQQQQAAAAPAPAAGADAYYEQFFRYAYYYGEDAARTHYGAWSPPPGTPNPYGVNPAGITAVPAATAAATAAGASAAGGQAAPAPAAAQAPAAPVAPSAEARETGRRQVSNLPAWMTKK